MASIELVATNGSEHTEKAVSHAIEIAELSEAELHAVCVINLVSPPGTLDINAACDPGSKVSIDCFD